MSAASVIGLMADGKSPHPHYSRSRRNALLTDLLEKMAHDFPDEQLPALLQADLIFRATHD